MPASTVLVRAGAFMATTSYSPRPPPTNLLRKLSMATADEAHDGRRGLLSTTSQAVKLVPSKRIATLAASQRAGGRARRGRALGRPLLLHKMRSILGQQAGPEP
mmetsp:Transcript_152846/g.490313  ORF Transcript_152846/g.490313 Transcript_152846/m.490313 type:complete len:104 (+) Transcript_152846:685-996(+)